jgi:hypothetical protein
MWWPLERLLDRWVGASFRTFVNGLVPANPNDVYYNDRCAICWGHYDDDHRGIRLPCNHIFGGGCLHDLIAETNTNLCPICRYVWYRDTGFWAVVWLCVVAFRTWLLHFVLPMVVKIQTAWLKLYHLVLPMAARIRTIWLELRSRYPRTYLVLLVFHLLNNSNFYYLAHLLIKKQTNLRDRNLGLDVLGVAALFQIVRVVYMLYTLWLKGKGTVPMGHSAVDSLFRMGMTLSMILLASVFNIHGTIHTRRDRLLHIKILVLAAAITHATNIWTMACYFMNKDPLSVIVAPAGKSESLALLLETVFTL